MFFERRKVLVALKYITKCSFNGIQAVSNWFYHRHSRDDTQIYVYACIVLIIQYTRMRVRTLYIPRVKAGYNTSTVVPASRKRRQNGNTVSDETVKCGVNNLTSE
jgi:hypothetical protein